MVICLPWRHSWRALCGSVHGESERYRDIGGMDGYASVAQLCLHCGRKRFLRSTRMDLASQEVWLYRHGWNIAEHRAIRREKPMESK